VSFEVSADAYGRFMGRFSAPLAEAFLDVVGVSEGQRALDVGCGSGVLTTALVERLGVQRVSAVDPSRAFVEAVREKYPSMDVRGSTAEALEFGDETFDLVLSQLVVHFMTDPVAGLRQMARVAVRGGIVGANVWDHAGESGPLAVFWSAVRLLDPQARDESRLPGVSEGGLAQLFVDAGLTVASSTALTVSVDHVDFDEWWQPFTLGVGPAGTYVAALDDAGRDRLRETCRAMLPAWPFATRATAWTVWAHV